MRLRKQDQSQFPSKLFFKCLKILKQHTRVPEAVLLVVANRAEEGEKNKLVSMNPASNKCRLVLGRLLDDSER